LAELKARDEEENRGVGFDDLDLAGEVDKVGATDEERAGHAAKGAGHVEEHAVGVVDAFVCDGHGGAAAGGDAGEDHARFGVVVRAGVKRAVGGEGEVVGSIVGGELAVGDNADAGDGGCGGGAVADERQRTDAQKGRTQGAEQHGGLLSVQCTRGGGFSMQGIVSCIELVRRRR
jgi:hypothetical protein